MPAVLQIVSGVGSTTPILDLNDNPAGIMVSRGDSSAGGLALASVSAADATMPTWTPAGAASAPEATSRTITVPVTLFGSSIDAVGAKVQNLMKLTAQPWVLRVRRSGASTNGWIRCYPTIPAIDTNVTGNHGGGLARGTITATTEPYAYGARVDTAAVNVPQDAAAANAFTLDVPSVAGDAPTPAFIRCNDTAVTTGPHGTLFAVRRTGNPTALTGLVSQAEAAAATQIGTGTNTTYTAPYADASFSGGQGLRLSFAAAYDPTGGNGLRMITTPAALTGQEASGLYKVLMRARRSTNDEFQMSLRVASLWGMDAVTFAQGGTNTRVVDLGIVQLPTGQPQQLAAPTATVLGASPPAIWVDVVKTTGTAASNFDVDWFALIPADEDLGVVYQSAGASSAEWLTIDGYAQDAFLTTGDPLSANATGYSGGIKLDYVGGVPRLSPSITNRIYVVGGLSSVGNTPPITQSAAWSVSYWPRYTWLP